LNRRVRVRYVQSSDWANYIAPERDADVKRFVNGPSEKDRRTTSLGA